MSRRLGGWKHDLTSADVMESVMTLLMGKPEGYLLGALPRLKDLAEKVGYAEAQFVLGVLYEKGEGVPKDERRAHEWQLKAAKQGHSGAAYRIGSDFFLGRRGVPQSDAEAVKWLKKSAEAGFVRGQSALAEAYLIGLMGPGREKEAAAWIERAAKSGDAESIRLRDEWRASGRIR